MSATTWESIVLLSLAGLTVQIAARGEGLGQVERRLGNREFCLAKCSCRDRIWDLDELLAHAVVVIGVGMFRSTLKLGWRVITYSVIDFLPTTIKRALVCLLFRELLV